MQSDPALHTALLNVGTPNNAFDIAIHAWWPSGSDPFYLANTVDNSARINYYGITGTPSMKCDGVTASWPSIQSIIQSEMGNPSPLWMDLITQVNGNVLNLTAKCVANTNITGNYVIQMALLDRYSYLPQSPNGQPHHYHALRKLAPSAQGQAFSAPVPGDTVTYSASFTIQTGWSVANLDVTAFVQNNTTREVLQARCEQVPLNFPNLAYASNAITDPNQNGRAEPGEACQMNVTLTNGQYYQTATDIVGTLSTNDPTITITNNTANFPNIAPGGQGVSLTPFAFTVSSSAQPHTATFHLHVVCNPLQTVYDTDFQIYIDFQSVLLVDDDGGSNFQTWYLMDLDSLGIGHEYWDTNTQGEVTTAWTNNFTNVIWFTSNLTAPISTGEETTITNYLNQGGHLMLVGEELDEQFRGTAFYANVLHAVSLTSFGFFQLTGVAGDPISNGTTLTLVGGTGAGNSYSPNCINPGTGAYLIYTYNNSGSGGALRWSSGNQKLVYVAFNFEAVSGIASTPRRTVLNNILNWFAGASAPAINVTMTPINPPINIPANGGSFQFNATVQRTQAPQAAFYAWARNRYPNGSYSGNLLGPVNINPPVGVTVTRTRTQVVDAAWPAGANYYIGYANTTVAYPAIDADSFLWTKLTTADGGPMVWEAANYGEEFPYLVGGSSTIPTSFSLVGASPNPFNPSTAISYQLPASSFVNLKVYDTTGRLVAQLVNGQREAGTHQITFDGSNLASGVYLYSLTAGSNHATGKMVLMK